MSNTGEFEVRNRHGDVVQRGEIEVVDVTERETEHGVLVEHQIQFTDPAKLARTGDVLLGSFPTEV